MVCKTAEPSFNSGGGQFPAEWVGHFAAEWVDLFSAESVDQFARKLQLSMGIESQILCV